MLEIASNVAWAAVVVSATTLLACSGASDRGSAPVDEVVAAPAPEPSSEPASDESETEPMRVLVTGFNDWNDLGEPANVWRCRDNPSCRLLLGGPTSEEPASFSGPLVERLREAAPDIEWRFATLPVTWGVFAEVPDDVDVIVNIGLGVYDRFDALQLEAGAYNLRRGADAAGLERAEPIDAAGATVLDAPRGSPIPQRLAALAGQTLAGYEVVVAEARESNSYLCNETHFRALTAIHAASHGRLREVYFLHIPYAEDDDYEALAEGVAGVVLALQS